MRWQCTLGLACRLRILKFTDPNKLWKWLHFCLFHKICSHGGLAHRLHPQQASRLPSAARHSRARLPAQGRRPADAADLAYALRDGPASAQSWVAVVAVLLRGTRSPPLPDSRSRLEFDCLANSPICLPAADSARGGHKTALLRLLQLPAEGPLATDPAGPRPKLRD